MQQQIAAGLECRVKQLRQLRRVHNLRRFHTGNVGADPCIEGLAPFLIIVYGNILVSQQFREAGLGKGIARTEIHRVIAPVIGDSHADRKDLHIAPDLFGADAQICSGHRCTAENRHRLRNVHRRMGKHLKKPVRVVLSDQDDVASALDHALEQIDRDGRLQIDPGIPLQPQADLLDGVDGTENLEILRLQTDAGGADSQCGLAVQNLHDTEAGRYDQLERRHRVRHKDGVVNIGDSAAAALEPDDAAAIDVEARIEPTDVEIDVVGYRDVVVALEGELRLQ